MTTKDFVERFGASPIVLPIIQLIQSISIAKAFGKLYSYDVDPTQELLALGISNFLGSFVGGWPCCSSFSRSAVKGMSGTKSPFSGYESFYDRSLQLALVFMIRNQFFFYLINFIECYKLPIINFQTQIFGTSKYDSLFSTIKYPC